MPTKTATPRPPLSEAQEQTLRDYVAWYSGNDYTLQKAADLIECSAGSLSGIITGTYKGDTPKYIKRMAERLAAAREEEGSVRQVPFVVTSVAEKVFTFCDRCRALHKMGFIRTRSGVGKTMALTAYADDRLVTTIKITAFKNYTSRCLLADLARRYGLADDGAEASMFRPVVSNLRTTRPLIIIDEADFLGAARDTLRHIHDQAEVGVVIAGTAAFLEKLQRRPASTDGQFLRRLVYRLDIDRIVEEDGQKLATFFKLSSAAWQRAWDTCYGNAARLVETLLLAHAFAAGEAISPQNIADAANVIPVPAEL